MAPPAAHASVTTSSCLRDAQQQASLPASSLHLCAFHAATRLACDLQRFLAAHLCLVTAPLRFPAVHLCFVSAQ